MNATRDRCSAKNGGNLPFFEFGTLVAKYWASRMVREKRNKVQGEYQMSAFEYAGNRAVAAVFAIAVSVASLAIAVVPASPAGLIA